VQVSDPVAQGFVASVSRPGGNLTGFSHYEFSIAGKWLNLLKEVAPSLARVAAMFNPDTSPQSKFFTQAVEAAAPALGVQAIVMPIRTTADIERDVASLVPNGGFILTTDSFAQLRYSLIADLARRYRVPSISYAPDFAISGGLMAYGTTIDQVSQFRQAASYVDRILKGAKPGDLPIQSAVRFDFVINLKTAKMLGLEIPPGVLAIADEVIE
jgi:ABC-type uncharacterized transport system substrate-binding protein